MPTYHRDTAEAVERIAFFASNYESGAAAMGASLRSWRAHPFAICHIANELDGRDCKGK